MNYDALPQMGVPVHHRDLESVLDAIDGFVRTGLRTGRSHQVVTVNTDFLVQARRHPDVHAILRTADLAVPDGMPIVWASAALGRRLPSRIAGADLVGLLAARAAQQGYRVMFFGGGEGVAERAAALLRAEHPGLIIESLSGMVGENGETDAELLEQIRRFRPAVICVALGHPKQERWIRRHAAALSIPVGIGVGGTFDFIAGERKRAAPWIQRSGFEWLHRLAQEPGRLTQRYLADFAVYLPRIFSQIGTTRLRSLRRDLAGMSPSVIDIVRSDDTSLVVALTRTGPLDHRTVAELTSLATQAHRQGRRMCLVTPDPAAIRSLQKLRLDGLVALAPASERTHGRSRPFPVEQPAPARTSSEGGPRLRSGRLGAATDDG